MYSGFSFWIWFTIIMQVLTAIYHSTSFFAKPKPRNDTEKQLVDRSPSFTLIYIFGAVVNWYFLKEGMSQETWHGLMLIEMIVYGVIFISQIRFTFLLPIIATGLVFLAAAGTYFFGTVH